MSGDAMRTLSRRRLILGTPAALLVASGCTGLMRGRDPAPEPVAQGQAGPWRLRIAIFEMRSLGLPYHTGLLIDAPEGRILYDPAGRWRHQECQRHADVHHPMTDATVAAYLNRDGFGFAPESWQLHLFEAEVPAAVASRAHSLAIDRIPAPSLACTHSVATLLSELDGFDDLRAHVVTARLLSALQARPDLSYTTRIVPRVAQQAEARTISPADG